MKNVCEKFVYEELLVSLMFLSVHFFIFVFFISMWINKTFLRVRMGRILNLLFRGVVEGKESSEACEQSRGEKSR